jgi:hypothetical protein
MKKVAFAALLAGILLNTEACGTGTSTQPNIRTLLRITASISPPPNPAGWNNTDVTVSFACSGGTRGVASCPAPVRVDSEGSNQTVTGTTVDRAGNSASASVTVNLDKTPPGIAATASPPPNPAGWNNSNVTVTFVCADSLSGIETCPAPVLVTSEGGTQQVLGEARDKAGNTATASASVSLDKTPPSLAVTEPALGGTVEQSPVTIRGTATDAHSGIAEVTCGGAAAASSAGEFNCDVAVPDGSNTIPIEARDLAGNVGTASAQFVAALAELELMYIDRFQSTDTRTFSSPGFQEIGYVYYRPEAIPQGYYSLGDSAPLPGVSLSFTMAARELKPGALAAPASYSRQFLVSSPLGPFFVAWRPIPPSVGYVCLGLLVRPAVEGPPGPNDMRCVRQDLTRAGKAGVRMGNHYIDPGGHPEGPTSWQLVPGDAEGIYTGQFGWSDSYDEPSSGTLRVIDAHAVRVPRLSSTEVVALIEKYGPVIRLHTEENFRPDDPEYVLNRSSLQWGLVPTETDYNSFSQQLLGQVATSPATLMGDVAIAQSAPQAGDPSFRTWIGIPDALKPGNLSQARVLVRTRPWNSIFTEIQFWIYYPFNGPGKIHVKCGSAWDDEEYMDIVGRHYSDWEHVSLLLDSNGSLVSLYLSRHDLNVWVTQKDFGSLGWQDSHPVIYAAKDSHAHYASAGNQHYRRVVDKEIWLGPVYICTLKIDLEDWTDNGVTLEGFNPGTYRFVSSAIPGANSLEPEPDWLQFTSRWGQYEKLSETYTVPIAFGYTYDYTQKEVGVGPSGPAMKTAWNKGDWCAFSGTCQ